mgnify:CR=1 FL=1|tara:strand:- start:4668 stop:4814 length:147 start_codon:yes stop_codon:yes gene_type:complete
MKKTQKIFLLWLVLVVAWNFGAPEAEPVCDVIVAVVLSVLVSFLGKRQ